MRRTSFYSRVFFTFSLIVATAIIGAAFGFMRVLGRTITDYEIRNSSQITEQLAQNLDSSLGRVQSMIGDLVRRLSDESSHFSTVLLQKRMDLVRSDRAALIAFDEFFYAKLAEIPALTQITVYAAGPDEFVSYAEESNAVATPEELLKNEAFQRVRSGPDFFEFTHSDRSAERGIVIVLTAIVDSSMNQYGVLAAEIDLGRALGLASATGRVGQIVVFGRNGSVYLSLPDGDNESDRALERLDTTAGSPDVVRTGTHVAVSKRTRGGVLSVVNMVPYREIYEQVYRSRRLALLLVAALLVASTATVSFVSRHIASRIHRLGLGMRRLQEGSWGVQIDAGTDASELSNLELIFNEMSVMLKNLVNRDYIAQMNLKQAQLVALQSQIRPHFLFNTLESIRLRLIDQGHEEEARPLRLLADLFSAVIRDPTQLVTLERELRYCE